jgi:hypothetical protein
MTVVAAIEIGTEATIEGGQDLLGIGAPDHPAVKER